MIYSDFQDMKLSQLGFGAMRLPMNGDAIDEEQLARMVDCAIAGGVNYFDTAYPYHGGESERALGRVLAAYPRDQFYLATKYPGHQISDHYDPAEIFEEQLEKCGVDYFDFYLLHNVYEQSIETYLDPKWGILDYFLEQKKNGRIRHLGFSTHGSLQCMRRFLDACGEHMEFCQIQLNYLDWTLQQAKEKCELLAEYHLPIWVMEPLRGGKLTKLPDADEAKLRALRPDESMHAWAFRFLQEIDGVKVILSGMSSMEQMQDNVRIFEAPKPLNAAEREALLQVAENQKNSVPCTACRYCCEGCPKGLDIPKIIASYNDFRYAASFNATMWIEALPEDKRPSACIGCGKCTKICPQGIDIPTIMKDFADRIAQQPSWAEICRQRAEAARKGRKG